MRDQSVEAMLSSFGRMDLEELRRTLHGGPANHRQVETTDQIARLERRLEETSTSLKGLSKMKAEQDAPVSICSVAFRAAGLWAGGMPLAVGLSTAQPAIAAVGVAVWGSVVVIRRATVASLREQPHRVATRSAIEAHEHELDSAQTELETLLGVRSEDALLRKVVHDISDSSSNLRRHAQRVFADRYGPEVRRGHLLFDKCGFVHRPEAGFGRERWDEAFSYAVLAAEDGRLFATATELVVRSAMRDAANVDVATNIGLIR